jgi:undecaprenyl-diphosphatase
MDKKKTALHHRTLRLSIALLCFWAPAILFAKLAGEVREREPILADVAILHWIHSHATPFLDAFFLAITTLGNAEVILPVALAACLLLWHLKQRTHAVILLFAFGGAGVANFLLKLLFHRERPAFWQSAITETSYSFPSGHAMVSAALILALMYILWTTKWRIASLILGAALIVLIGTSRLYMGVHYPTDIIAGWTVALLWVATVVVVSKRTSLWLHKHYA